jgi:hypothetical protein
MDNKNFHLKWLGPYAIRGDCDDNLFQKSPDESRQWGVYVWTIPIGGEYWPWYIGKSEDKGGVLERLRKEAKSKPANRYFIDDIELLLKGERKTVYSPLNSSTFDPDEAAFQKDPVYYTECVDRFLRIARIFIAPMDDMRDLIWFTEGALIWHVFDYEWDHWGNRPCDANYFLSNSWKDRRRRPTEPYTITMDLPAKIRGFEPVNEYTEPRY